MLGALVASCGGGGGGGGSSSEDTRDPMEGEGTLMTPPAEEALGRAPSSLIPAGYSLSRLDVSSADASFALELISSYSNPLIGSMNGPVSGTVELFSGEMRGSRHISGIWVQQSYNEHDRIRDIMLECSSDKDETINIFKLDLSINSRAEGGASLTFTGTVTSGILSASKGDTTATLELEGASFTLVIER